MSIFEVDSFSKSVYEYFNSHLKDTDKNKKSIYCCKANLSVGKTTAIRDIIFDSIKNNENTVFVVALPTLNEIQSFYLSLNHHHRLKRQSLHKLSLYQ